MEPGTRHKIHADKFRTPAVCQPPEVGYAVQDVPMLADTLNRVGDLAKTLGHRLTMHPGQFCQLASVKESIFHNAVRELRYHCDVLSTIGLGKDSVMIIHMGGMYGDKQATLDRFVDRWPSVPPDIRERIVLENDELCYSVADLLPVCEKLEIPLVLDWHHAAINPSVNPPEVDWPRIRAIWDRRGIRPKQHYSESREGATTIMERRAHSKRVSGFPPGGRRGRRHDRGQR